MNFKLFSGFSVNSLGRLSALGVLSIGLVIGCNPVSEEESPEVDPNLSQEVVSSSVDGASSQVIVSSQTLSSGQQISSQTTVSSQVGSSSQSTIDVPCYEAFASQNGAGYSQGAQVSYQSRNYVATRWASDYETPDVNAAFDFVEDCGTVSVSSQAQNSSATQVSSQTQVSSSSVGVSSSSQDVIVGAVAGWLTEDIFNTVFPNRAPFYTFQSFAQAFNDLQNIVGYNQAPTYSESGTFNKFLQEGTLEQKKREAAAFFANIVQETGRGSWNTGLYHRVETCANDGGNPPGPGSVTAHCASDYKSNNNVWGGPASGKYYYGRGPMQLSWNYNYAWFSHDAFGNKDILVNNPDLVHTDAKVAWLAAMWFWNRREYWAPAGQAWGAPANPTLHELMLSNRTYDGDAGFGGTIQAINGGYECPTNAKALKRGDYYKSMQSALGIPVDSSNLTCR